MCRKWDTFKYCQIYILKIFPLLQSCCSPSLFDHPVNFARIKLKTLKLCFFPRAGSKLFLSVCQSRGTGKSLNKQTWENIRVDKRPKYLTTFTLSSARSGTWSWADIWPRDRTCHWVFSADESRRRETCPHRGCWCLGCRAGSRPSWTAEGSPRHRASAGPPQGWELEYREFHSEIITCEIYQFV